MRSLHTSLMVLCAAAGPCGMTAPVVAGEMSEIKLIASDAATEDFFGTSVSLDGDTAIVGARGDDHPPLIANAGSAYIFTLSGTAWTQQAKLTALDATFGDNFGVSVCIDGDTAIVGADFDGSGGSAYIFVRSGTAWTQQAKLKATDAGSGDRFGVSVSLDGDTAIVGAMFDDHPGAGGAGSAYVFTRSGTSWTQQAKLIASDAASAEHFGVSVSIDGDKAIVGGEGYDTPGAAYIFTRSGTAWTEQAKLTASDAAYGDRFGCSVSIDGETAIVGAKWDDLDDRMFFMDNGSAYIFTGSEATWTQQAKLTASDAVWDELFGCSVFVDGDTAIVGAYFDDHAGGMNAGSAYLFMRSGTTWTQHVKLTAFDAGASDFFGGSVCIDGDAAIVGASSDSHDGGTDAGSAYIHPPLTSSSPTDLNSDGDVDGLDLAMLLASWGPCPSRGAPGSCPADLDASGNVNGTDLAMLLAAWG